MEKFMESAFHWTLISLISSLVYPRMKVIHKVGEIWKKIDTQAEIHMVWKSWTKKNIKKI